MRCVSPWYNRTGWLGVKHQLTYSLCTHTQSHTYTHVHAHARTHTHYTNTHASTHPHKHSVSLPISLKLKTDTHTLSLKLKSDQSTDHRLSLNRDYDWTMKDNHCSEKAEYTATALISAPHFLMPVTLDAAISSYHSFLFSSTSRPVSSTYDSAIGNVSSRHRPHSLRGTPATNHGDQGLLNIVQKWERKNHSWKLHSVRIVKMGYTGEKFGQTT